MTLPGDGTAAAMFQRLGQVMAESRENSIRIGALENRMEAMDSRVLSLIQAIPIEIRRFGLMQAIVGALIGSFLGVIGGVLIVKALLLRVAL